MEIVECSTKRGGGFFKHLQGFVGVQAKFSETMLLLKFKNHIKETGVVGFEEKAFNDRENSLPNMSNAPHLSINDAMTYL